MSETLSLFNDPSTQEKAPRTPFPAPATATLIALNILVYLAMVFTGVSPFSPTGKEVIPWGANFGPLTLNGQWWRIVTACFIHFGIIHIAMNMYILFQIGVFTEILYGKVRFLLIYLLCGLGGSIASLYIHPFTTGAGASGAIFGLYGALLGFLLVARGIIPKDNAFAILKSAGIFLTYNFLFGLADGKTDLSAHIGGLIAGFIAGSVLARPHSKRPGSLPIARTVATAVVGIVAVAACFRYIAGKDHAEAELVGLYALGTSVPVGTTGRVIYSGSATKAEAEALAQKLTTLGMGRQSGGVFLFSKDASGPTLSFSVGMDEAAYKTLPLKTSELVNGKTVIKPSEIPGKPFPWDDPKILTAFQSIGVSVAPLIGGPPLRVQLLNNKGNLKKTLQIDTRDEVIGTFDHVWYSGNATKQDAQALGKALQSIKFFKDEGIRIQLTRAGTATDLFFPVSDGKWDDPQATVVFQYITRHVAASVGGLPIDVHISDTNFQPRKSFTVR